MVDVKNIVTEVPFDSFISDYELWDTKGNPKNDTLTDLDIFQSSFYGNILTRWQLPNTYIELYVKRPYDKQEQFVGRTRTAYHSTRYEFY